MSEPNLEAAFEPIIGLHLSGIGRALNMGLFLFGPNVTVFDSRTSTEHIGSAYALHVQCAFRVTRNGRIVLGSDDMLVPAEALREGKNANSEGGELSAFDVIAARITAGIELSPLVVHNVIFAACGDLRVELTDQVAIEAFPMGARPSEAWRFLRRGGDHVVFPPGAG